MIITLSVFLFLNLYNQLTKSYNTNNFSSIFKSIHMNPSSSNSIVELFNILKFEINIGLFFSTIL